MILKVLIFSSSFPFFFLLFFFLLQLLFPLLSCCSNKMFQVRATFCPNLYTAPERARTYLKHSTRLVPNVSHAFEYHTSFTFCLTKKKKSVEAHPTSPKEPSNTQKSSDTATQTSIPKPSVDPVAPALAKRYSKLTARKFVHPIPPTTK